MPSCIAIQTAYPMVNRGLDRCAKHRGKKECGLHAARPSRNITQCRMRARALHGQLLKPKPYATGATAAAAGQLRTSAVAQRCYQAACPWANCCIELCVV